MPQSLLAKAFDPRRNTRRAPFLAALGVLGIAWTMRPTLDGIRLSHACAAPRTDFEIVDPDASKRPDPSAPRAPRRYDTFAHRVLDIDAGEAPVAAARYAMLDDIIDEVKRRVSYDAEVKGATARRRQAQRVLETIDDVLTERGFLYPPGDYDVVSLRSALAPQRLDRGTLDRLLRVGINERRRSHARAHADGPFHVIDCDISSFVYVGVGEALGFAIRLVDLPDHMFVRWEFPDGTHLNWDTNDAAVIPDKEYAADHELSRKLRKGRVYLASMTRREAEGYAYFLRAARLEDRGRDAEAIADLEKARELYPQSTQVKSELAWLYATAAGVDAARRKSAVELARAAVDLEPQCGDFWDSLAAAQAANGDFDRAVASAERAEKFAETPEDRAEYRQRRKAYEQGEMPFPERDAETDKS